MDSPILKAVNIHKKFKHPTPLTILKGVDLKAYRGDSIAILGRSGEGKSTLLQILGTLEPATEGTITIAGQEVSSFNAAKIRAHHIGFIFQSFCLLDDFTTLENILMPARILRKDISKKSEAYKQARMLLEQIGLSSRSKYPVKVLSGGEKQRIAIARALCNNPELLLADEPSGNLDKENANKIHSLLLDLCHTLKKTLIVVTHDHELASLCKTRLRLEQGTLTNF